MYRSAATHLVAVVLLVLVAGCSDTTSSDDRWDLEALESGEWEKLDGPPGRIHRHLGQIGEIHYFDLGRLDDNDIAMPARYHPNRGWTDAPELYRALAESGFPNNSWLGQSPQFVGDGNYHYFAATGETLNGQPQGMLRTPDAGSSWEQVPTLPDLKPITAHGVHRGNLYVVGGPPTRDGSSGIWRTDDGGESWDLVREDVSAADTLILEEWILTTGADSFDLEVSTDGGESWETYPQPEGCERLTRQPTTFRHRGETYFVDDTIRKLSLSEGCPAAELEGLASNDHLRDVEKIGGRLVGVTYSDELGVIDDELTEWNEMSPPRGVEIRELTSGHLAPVVDLGDGTIGVATSHGLMRIDNYGEWSAVTDAFDAFATPTGIHSWNGGLLVQTRGGYFRRENGDWQPFAVRDQAGEELLVNNVFVRDDQLFVVGRIEENLYRVDNEWRAHRVWRGNEHGAALSRPGLAIDLRFHDDRVFLHSSGQQDRTRLPAPDSSEEPFRPGHGGGIYVADSLGGEFETFGEGLPEVTEEGHASVRSMVFHEDDLWVVTGRTGVWRADLEEGTWRRAHAGLPTRSDGEGTKPVDRLTKVDGRLYAIAQDAVFERTSSGWSRLTSRQLSNDWDLGVARHGIADLLEYRNRIVAVTHRGLYLVDRDTGEHRLFWRPEHGLIFSAQVLESGLYAGVFRGGIHRFVPED